MNTGVNFEHFKAPNTNDDDRYGEEDTDQLLCQAAQKAEVGNCQGR